MSHNSYMIKSSKTITFLDDNDFIKKYRSLRKYCPNAYKTLAFDILKNQKFSKKIGKHEIELPTNKIFEKVYGKIKLIYSFTGKTIILENLEPSQFLQDGNIYYLESYKGIPFRNDKDKFKIDMALKMKG